MEKSKASAAVTVFWKTDTVPGFEVARIENNMKVLNLAKGNCEYGTQHENGEDARRRAKYVYDVLQTFRPSRIDSEENDRVALCLINLRLAYYGHWLGIEYKALSYCLSELYEALAIAGRRLELWKSIKTHGEVCKAARDAAAYTLPRMGGEDFATILKKGAAMTDELSEAIRESVAKQGGAKRRKRGKEDESAKAEGQ